MTFLGHFFELFSFKSNKFDFGQRYPLNLYLKLTTTAVISDMLHENFHLLNSTKYLKNFFGNLRYHIVDAYLYPGCHVIF